MEIKFRILLFFLPLLLTTNAHAGLYTDDLSRCLVESTTQQDKVRLVKWIFTATSLHPELITMSSVSNEQRNQSNKDAADLFVKLFTESCIEQSEKAVKYEGGVAIQQSFQLFGQVAASEVFANPAVVSGMAELEKHFDLEKFKSIYGKQ